jgi:hypothetical protein
VLPVATDMDETVLVESYDRELRKVPLAYNTVGIRISDISENICGHLIDELKTSHSVQQADVAIYEFKDAHLVTYVGCLL